MGIYLEIVVIGVILFLMCEYSGVVSTKKFIRENRGYLLKLKEEDYDFLMRAAYGQDVDLDEAFNKRIRYGIYAIGIAMFILITSLNYLTALLVVLAAFVAFKFPYWNVKSYRRRHMHQIDVQLPYYLKTLEILIQHYTVPVALGKSIEAAPPIFKDGLQELVDSINAGDSSIEPYMKFARDYPVRDSMRMMRLLYRLSLGRQERKQEQLMTFSKTISNLQQKAREIKYTERLEKMESKTMTMLVTTGIGVMVLLIISILMTFTSF